MEIHRRCDPEYPVCVVVALPRHNLCVGLGADPSFVRIYAAPYTGDYYTSVGDPGVQGAREFYGCGEQTRVENRSLIALADALEAVRHFVEHGRRLRCLRWKKQNPGEQDIPYPR